MVALACNEPITLIPDGVENVPLLTASLATAHKASRIPPADVTPEIDSDPVPALMETDAPIVSYCAPRMAIIIPVKTLEAEAVNV